MQVRDVTEHAVDRLGGRPALSLGFRQSEGVPVEPHEEQERVVLAGCERQCGGVCQCTAACSNQTKGRHGCTVQIHDDCST